jgi:ATP-dependent Clp protease ATP-binding subunit ClpA
LTEAVLGQDEAIGAVVTELQLIKSGLTEADKPASVMLFAGMTGVGKTELAKRIANIYSASKQLHVYTMANFTEPHSVSGIIGVPPGYVGHEQGGRLINELNADPYSVFLLDEAEKCHPNVWKPFLNLFDEGWIVDQRGVKAHADRAIFILTSNAGDNAISQMTAQNKPMGEIVEHVKNRLSKIRLERSTQPVFPPQFLSRIKRILVFRPLGEPAMIEIARKLTRAMAEKWLSKRAKQVIVPETSLEQIGRRAFALNEAARGQEGGRLIARLIAEHIEAPMQEAALEWPDEYEHAARIIVDLREADTSDSWKTSVSFE